MSGMKEVAEAFEAAAGVPFGSVSEDGVVVFLNNFLH